MVVKLKMRQLHVNFTSSHWMPVQSPAAKPMLMTITGMGYCAHAVPSRVNVSVIVSSIQIPIRSNIEGCKSIQYCIDYHDILKQNRKNI